MTTRPGEGARLDVGVVGAGRVGAVLGSALQRAGHAVVAVSAVSDASVARAHRLLPGVPVLGVTEVVAAADLVLLAVPDETLPGLVTGLAATEVLHPGQIVVHTSPAFGIGVLEPAGAHDVLPVALHPAIVLTGTRADLDRLAGVSFAVTTVKPLRPLGEALVIEMGGEPVWVEEEDRPAYAAALAAVREGVEGVVGAAGRVLADCGIERPSRLLAPLVGSAFDAAAAPGSLARGRASGAPDDEAEEPE
jgi:predicted short-subunit dehydrogenase-like oxidoreductase (DUF2520 family)